MAIDRACTRLRLKGVFVWLLRFHSFAVSKCSLCPHSYEANIGPDLWPLVRDVPSCRGTNRACVWGIVRSASAVALPFVPVLQGCGIGLSECDAILYSRMSSIVPLNKGSLSHYWTVSFFSGFDSGGAQGEAGVCFFVVGENVIWSSLLNSSKIWKAF